LAAIELGICGRLPKDDVKNRCMVHALQWAAEIEGGKSPGCVVPTKIANFISTSIMGEINRAAVADVRLAHAKPKSATGETYVVPKKVVKVTGPREGAMS
jgi:hypothetical protein